MKKIMVHAALHHYIDRIEKKIPIPAFVTAPWMIRDAGLIYGIR